MAKAQAKRSRGSTLGVAIVGGGSGGRVYPGIAVARELKRQVPNARVLFIGTAKGVEANIVPYEGFSFETIETVGEKLRGETKLKTLMRYPGIVKSAMAMLKRFQPSVVLGIGGDVSVPVLYAAYLLRIPTVILESNRQPSTVHRLLSRSVDKIALCYEESRTGFPKKKTLVTGSPVRREFFLIGATPPPDKGKKLNVLVMAGEQGARTINYTMIAALDHLKAHRDTLTFTHQTGHGDFEYVKAGYERRDFRAEVHQYIRDIPRIYAKSHLVIARSGTSTVSELKASGRPAILVPYPRDDKHQEANALALKDAGLAQIIAQSQFSGRSLAQEIIRVLEHPEELAQAWSYSRGFQEQDATMELLQACLQLVKGAGATGIDI